jgi:hypothetical protein
MEHLRENVRADIASLDGMQDVWNKMPEEYHKELIDFILQKMAWAERRGYDNGLEEADQNRSYE